MLNLTVIGHDVDVDVSTLAPVDRAALARAWSRCTRRTSEGHPVRLDLGTGTSAAAASEALTTQITVAAITARRHDLLMLHAGAVADPATGAVVAFVGRSGSGKTTASIALGRHFGYVSDETTAVRDDLTVVPYPKPLSVINPGADHVKDQVSPDDLELLEPPELPLRLVAVLLLDRDPHLAEGSPARLDPAPLAENIPELVAQISFLGARDRPLHRVRDVLAACGGLQRVTYREAADLPDLVRGIFARAAPPPPAGTGPEVPAAGGLAVVAPGPGCYARAAVTDALVDDDALIVLQAERVTVYRGIAPTLWAAAAAPVTLDQIVHVTVAEHGRPVGVDPRTVVGSALQELVATGLITCG